MALGIVGDARVGGRSAVLRQLLGHRPQLRGGHESALQFAAAGDALRGSRGAAGSSMTDVRGCLPCPGMTGGLMPVRRRLSRVGLSGGMGGRMLFWLRSRVLRGPCGAGKEEQYQCQTTAGTQNGTQQ